jgi:alcohol dehydrogenase (NADP+)
MEQLLKTGKARAIGVSNFNLTEMEHLLKNTSVVPAMHEMECHPWLQQLEFTEWHRNKGIHVVHYSPFGNQNALYGEKSGPVKLLGEPVLAEIGEQYNKTPAQVVLGECGLSVSSLYDADCSVIWQLGESRRATRCCRSLKHP